MRMSLNPKIYVLVLSSFLACESEPNTNKSSTACMSGETKSCVCPSGLSGQETCNAEGSFGACMCSAPNPDSGAPEPDSGLLIDSGTPVDTGVPEDSGVHPDADMPEDASFVMDAAAPPDTGVVADAGFIMDASTPLDTGVVVDAGTMPMMRPSCAAIVNPAAHTLCLDIFISVPTGTVAKARVRLIRAPGLVDPSAFQFDLVSTPSQIYLPAAGVKSPQSNQAAPSHTVAANNRTNAPSVPGSVTTLMFSLDPNAQTVTTNGDLIEFEIQSIGQVGDYELMFQNVLVSSQAAMALPFATYDATIKVR